MASDPLWIEHMHMRKGALHQALGIPQGQTIPAKKVESAAQSSNPTLSHEAHLAETLKKLHH